MTDSKTDRKQNDKSIYFKILALSIYLFISKMISLEVKINDKIFDSIKDSHFSCYRSYIVRLLKCVLSNNIVLN